MGSVSDQAGLLGPLEDVIGTVGYSVEVGLAEWDQDGELHAAGLTRVVHRLSGAVAWRIDPAAQFGVTMPVLIQGVRAGPLRGAGSGPGDLRTWITFEPAGRLDAPPLKPRITLAIVAPTGIPPEQAQQALAADATGSGYLRIAPSFDLEKPLGDGVLRVSIDGSFAVPRPWSATGDLPGVGIGASLSGVAFLTSGLTLAWAGGVLARTPGWYRGSVAGLPSYEPWSSVGVSFSGHRFDRVGVGLRGSLPIPKIGHSAPATVTLSVTYAHVER